MRAWWNPLHKLKTHEGLIVVGVYRRVLIPKSNF